MSLRPNEDKKARGEIKWQNTRSRGVEVRKAYIEYFLELLAANKIHFHIRFSPMNEYDHGGERRIFDTVSKMFYQLLLHRPVRHYGKTCQINIRPDNGECTRLLPGLKEALQIDGQLKYRTILDCINDIVPLDSKSEPLLQFLDVPVGALTAYRNERHLMAHMGEPKRNLASFAYEHFGKDLTANYDDGSRFSIWNVIPKRRGP